MIYVVFQRCGAVGTALRAVRKARETVVRFLRARDPPTPRFYFGAAVAATYTTPAGHRPGSTNRAPPLEKS